MKINQSISIKPKRIFLGTTDVITDINGSNIIIPWDLEDKKDSGWLHDNVTNNSRMTLDFPGVSRVELYFNLHINTAVVRYNGEVRVRRNGSTYLRGVGACGYIRAASGHNRSSISLFTEDHSPSNGDYYEVIANQEGAAGVANLVLDGCVFRGVLE